MCFLNKSQRHFVQVTYKKEMEWSGSTLVHSEQNLIEIPL